MWLPHLGTLLVAVSPGQGKERAKAPSEPLDPLHISAHNTLEVLTQARLRYDVNARSICRPSALTRRLRVMGRREACQEISGEFCIVDGRRYN